MQAVSEVLQKSSVQIKDMQDTILMSSQTLL